MTSIIVDRDIRSLHAKEGENNAYIAQNDAAFAAAAALGKVHTLPAGGLFLVSKQILLISGSGFVSDGEAPCEIVMSSDAGHFDAATYSNNFATNRLLFLAQSTGDLSHLPYITVDDINLIDLLIRLRAPTGGYIRDTFSAGQWGSTIPRTARVLEMRDIGGRDNNIRLFIRDFREQNGGYVAFNSCDRGHINWEINGWDCNPTSDDLAQGQASLLYLDNQRTNTPYTGTAYIGDHPTGGQWQGFSSNDMHGYGLRGYNFKAQEPWLTGGADGLHGGGGQSNISHQTDILTANAAGMTATAGFPGGDQEWPCHITIDEIVGDGVGEVADLQKSGMSIKRVWGRDVWDTGVCKIVYGPSDLHIDDVYGDLVRRSVVYIQPADDVLNSPAPRNVHDVRIRKVVGRRLGGLWTAAEVGAGNIGIGINIANSPNAGNKPYDIYMDDFDIEGGYASDSPGVTKAGKYAVVAPLLAVVGPRIAVRGKYRNLILTGTAPVAGGIQFIDTSLAAKFFDPTDPTKKFRFDVSGLTSGVERVATLPDLNFNVGTMLTDIASKQPLDGMLTALAALTSAADKGLRFTGADAPQIFDYAFKKPWTPVATFSVTTPGDITYNPTPQGWYWRIDTLWLVVWRMTFTSKGTAPSGDLRITGLPFTADANLNGAGVSHYSNIDMTAGYTQCDPVMPANTNYISFRQKGDNVAIAFITDVELKNNSVVSGWLIANS